MKTIAIGVEEERGRAFTERLFGELERTRPELRRFYYIGYCMDTPALTDYIRFCQSIGSPSGEFLQLNGLALRVPPAGSAAGMAAAVSAGSGRRDSRYGRRAGAFQRSQ